MQVKSSLTIRTVGTILAIIAAGGLIALVGTAVLLGTIWVPNIVAVYVAGCILGLATGLFVTSNWALGTRLVPPSEAGRYLGTSLQ